MARTEDPTYQHDRRPEVRSRLPWSPFAYVADRLEALVSDLLRPGLAGSPGSGSLDVLDYGCADSPYRHLVPSGARYVRADLPGNPAADVEIGAGGAVPLPSESCDVVLSTQVLEHVADPARYLGEAFRLLRPGGSLVLTTHGIMYYHPDPEDYWRWTRAGLAKVVADQGFAVDEVRGALGLAPASLQLFQESTFARVPKMLRRPYVLAFQTLIKAMDRRYSEDARSANCLVLAVRAHKPAP